MLSEEAVKCVTQFATFRTAVLLLTPGPISTSLCKQSCVCVCCKGACCQACMLAVARLACCCCGPASPCGHSSFYQPHRSVTAILLILIQPYCAVPLFVPIRVLPVCMVEYQLGRIQPLQNHLDNCVFYFDISHQLVRCPTSHVRFCYCERLHALFTALNCC